MQNTYPYLNPKFHLEETGDQSCLAVHRFGELKTKTCELIVEMTVTSKFTQQDGRKKRTTNAYEWQTWRGYYLRVLSWSSLNINVFLVFYKKNCLKGGEVWRKLLSRLSNKVNRLLSSPKIRGGATTGKMSPKHWILVQRDYSNSLNLLNVGELSWNSI